MDATVNRQVTQSIAIEQRIFFTGIDIPDPLCDDNYHRTGPTDGLIHWGLRYPSAVNFDRFHPSRLFTIITTPVCHFQQPLIFNTNDIRRLILVTFQLHSTILLAHRAPLPI